MGMDLNNLDVIVIGAGFSGILAVYKLRRLGFRVCGFERQGGLGGVWRENAYPGAAVDSPFPFYQFYDADLLRDWRWEEQFPTRAEMMRYFEQVDTKWGISASFEFGASVSGAEYSEATWRWVVSLEDGRRASAQWLIPAVGFSSVLNIPRIPGIDRFSGPVYHTARWPRDAMDMRGKKVAVIGTGPSGVQVIQSVGKVAKSMTIYQRTPCLTLPKYSNSPDRTAETLGMGPDGYREALRLGLQSPNGFDYVCRDQNTLMVPSEERDHFYRKRYLEGGWAFWMAGFRDLCRDPRANRDAYAFWAEQTRARISCTTKRELLIPEVPALPFGVKRPCLEEDLYEVMDQPQLDIIDISEKPIEIITETGICAHGKTIEFDAIILATGFGDEASGLKSLNIRGRNGTPLVEAWSGGVQSHLGIAIHQFPNMFFLYGPQCPTLLVNSPAVITVQVEWLCRVLSSSQRGARVSQLEATGKSHDVWRRKMGELWMNSLYHTHPRNASKQEQTW
ncbi:FAD/NAD(P)-binding domain-containing protein [Daldinia vernicosa]|uniref:FAD/NAD(P)-binding domain-containing protein n=1 Tax=Daldinia vernicosa TaxID=114800 RepID=UPI0020084EDB|nr:FAD/NAD(P)-binding domain-containing protein [Daldinia vernicosa]KAI0845504.1 FAD/NAD(P)-binding domain-containing protein [Daldinia vernicosa]